MLLLLVGTGIFLTIQNKSTPAVAQSSHTPLKAYLSKEARAKEQSEPVMSRPFSALTTALSCNDRNRKYRWCGDCHGIGRSGCSGLDVALGGVRYHIEILSECMLAIKYREVNAKGEMSGGPMYTMKKALRHKRFGCRAGLAVSLSLRLIASFGIGNLTQANSIAYRLECDLSHQYRFQSPVSYSYRSLPY